jgi:hypothetical protein
VRSRQVELVEQFQASPDADPVAVVAPGEGARIGRRAGHGEQMAIASAESEMLDVEAEIDRQPLALRPGIVLTFDDGRIGVAIVVGETEHESSFVVLSAEGPHDRRHEIPASLR